MTKPHIATLAIDIVLTASCKEKPTLLGLSTSLGHSLYQLGSLPLRFSKVYKRAKIGSWLLEVRIGISCVHLIVQVTWPSTMCRCLQFAFFSRSSSKVITNKGLVILIIIVTLSMASLQSPLQIHHPPQRHTRPASQTFKKHDCNPAIIKLSTCT